jgi:hypothetical protein
MKNHVWKFPQKCSEDLASCQYIHISMKFLRCLVLNLSLRKKNQQQTNQESYAYNNSPHNWSVFERDRDNKVSFSDFWGRIYYLFKKKTKLDKHSPLDIRRWDHRGRSSVRFSISYTYIIYIISYKRTEWIRGTYGGTMCLKRESISLDLSH